MIKEQRQPFTTNIHLDHHVRHERLQPLRQRAYIQFPRAKLIVVPTINEECGGTKGDAYGFAVDLFAGQEYV